MGTLTRSASSGEGETDQGVTWPPSHEPFSVLGHGLLANRALGWR
jgi:hypothetical protein